MAKLIPPARRRARPAPVPVPQLRDSLRIVGSRLKDADSLPNGRPDGTGLAHATVPAVHLSHLHELGSMLIRIADGEDAQSLFSRQKPRRGPRPAESAHRLASLAYYSARVEDPEADDTQAIAGARIFLKKSTPGSVVRYARKHRGWCLETLSKTDGYAWMCESSRIDVDSIAAGGAVLIDSGSVFIRCWGSEKTGPLKEHLRKKTRRPDGGKIVR